MSVDLDIARVIATLESGFIGLEQRKECVAILRICIARLQGCAVRLVHPVEPLN